MMNFALQMMQFSLKMMNFALNTDEFCMQNDKTTALEAADQAMGGRDLDRHHVDDSDLDGQLSMEES